MTAEVATAEVARAEPVNPALPSHQTSVARAEVGVAQYPVDMAAARAEETVGAEMGAAREAVKVVVVMGVVAMGVEVLAGEMAEETVGAEMGVERVTVREAVAREVGEMGVVDKVMEAVGDANHPSPRRSVRSTPIAWRYFFRSRSLAAVALHWFASCAVRSGVLAPDRY